MCLIVLWVLYTHQYPVINEEQMKLYLSQNYVITYNILFYIFLNLIINRIFCFYTFNNYTIELFNKCVVLK